MLGRVLFLDRRSSPNQQWWSFWVLELTMLAVTRRAVWATAAAAAGAVAGALLPVNELCGRRIQLIVSACPVMRSGSAAPHIAHAATETAFDPNEVHMPRSTLQVYTAHVAGQFRKFKLVSIDNISHNTKLFRCAAAVQ
jgi:hypothetical protein